MKIEFGKCPFCKTNNYSRNDSEWLDDYVVVECICNDCNKVFTEYYSIDEVKFDEDGEEFIYTDCLSKEEKETIIDWANGELEMKENQFTNKSHQEDYKRRVKRIIKIMKGELIRE